MNLNISTIFDEIRKGTDVEIYTLHNMVNETYYEKCGVAIIFQIYAYCEPEEHTCKCSLIKPIIFVMEKPTSVTWDYWDSYYGELCMMLHNECATKLTIADTDNRVTQDKLFVKKQEFGDSSLGCTNTILKWLSYDDNLMNVVRKICDICKVS